MTLASGQENLQPANDQAVSQTAAEKRRCFPVRQRWYQWLRWGDFLLYGLIGGCAVVLFLALPLRGSTAATKAVLTRDSQVLLQVSAAEMAVPGETEITVGGYHYRLIWDEGRIRFAEADCPDRICVRTGWISRPDEIAACAPGRLILKIVGREPDQTNPDEPDVIVR
jgi:hypothetical protein